LPAGFEVRRLGLCGRVLWVLRRTGLRSSIGCVGDIVGPHIWDTVGRGLGRLGLGKLPLEVGDDGGLVGSLWRWRLQLHSLALAIPLGKLTFAKPPLSVASRAPRTDGSVTIVLETQLPSAILAFGAARRSLGKSPNGSHPAKLRLTT